jgi:flagellar hook-length control protein FliK
MMRPFVIPVATPTPVKQPERPSTAAPVAQHGQNDFSRMLAREMAQGSSTSGPENLNQTMAPQEARPPQGDDARAKANSGASANSDASVVRGGQQAAPENSDADASATPSTATTDSKIASSKQNGKDGQTDNDRDGDKSNDGDGKSAASAPPSAADQILALAAQLGKLNPLQSATATAANAAVDAGAMDPAAVDIAAGTHGLVADAAGLPLDANGRPVTARGPAAGNEATPGAAMGAADTALAGAAGAAQTGAAQSPSTSSFMAALASASGKAVAEGAASVEPLLAANGPTVNPAVVGLASGAAIAAAPGTIASASNALSYALAPAVGSNGWDQALGQRVVWMVSGGEQSASLSLNPPDLGPLQVVLNVSQGHATANFTAAQPEVRQALEAAMPRLRDMLENAGISLGQTNVSAGTPQQQQGGFGRPSASLHGAGQSRPDTDTRTGGVMPATGLVRRTGRDGMVDTFA